MKQMKIKKDILMLMPGVTFDMLDYAIRHKYILKVIEEDESEYTDDEGCGKWNKKIVEEL